MPPAARAAASTQEGVLSSRGPAPTACPSPSTLLPQTRQPWPALPPGSGGSRSPQGPHNQDQGATDKSWLYSRTRGQLCHWQLPSYCTSSDGGEGISMPRHNTASALRDLGAGGRGHRHHPAGWGAGLGAEGSQRQKTRPPIDRDIYKKKIVPRRPEQNHRDTRASGMYSSPRAGKHALYRHGHAGSSRVYGAGRDTER